MISVVVLCSDWLGGWCIPSEIIDQMSLNNDTHNGPWPKPVFLHKWGWEVIKAGPNRYQLSWAGKYNYIATFTTLDDAINYMNQEFL